MRFDAMTPLLTVDVYFMVIASQNRVNFVNRDLAECLIFPYTSEQRDISVVVFVDSYQLLFWSIKQLYSSRHDTPNICFEKWNILLYYLFLFLLVFLTSSVNLRNIDVGNIWSRHFRLKCVPIQNAANTFKEIEK